MNNGMEDLGKLYSAIRHIFNTEQGKVVLEGLKTMYVDTSAFVANDPQSTAYRLAEKEFVQRLIAYAESEEDFTKQNGENIDV